MKFEIISKLIVNVILFVFVIIFFKAIIEFSDNKKNEEEQILNTLNRALVQCYALEGNFPNDIYYLEKYGIIFNEEKYVYFYEPFGDRIPSLSIIKIDDGEVYYFGGRKNEKKASE